MKFQYTNFIKEFSFSEPDPDQFSYMLVNSDKTISVTIWGYEENLFKKVFGFNVDVGEIIELEGRKISHLTPYWSKKFKQAGKQASK